MSDRRYPPFYEKSLPVIMGAIALLVILLIVVALTVILGVFPH